MGWNRYTSAQSYETGDVLIALTDTAVRQAKPSGKNYTLKDAGGLALFVGPKGAKQCHFRFYWVGKQARMSLSHSIRRRLRQIRRKTFSRPASLSRGTAGEVQTNP